MFPTKAHPTETHLVCNGRYYKYGVRGFQPAVAALVGHHGHLDPCPTLLCPTAGRPNHRHGDRGRQARLGGFDAEHGQ